MKFRHVGRFYAKARGPPLSVCSGPPVKQHGRILRGGGFRTTVLQGGEALIRNTVHSQRPSCEIARKEFTVFLFPCDSTLGAGTRAGEELNSDGVKLILVMAFQP